MAPILFFIFFREPKLLLSIASIFANKKHNIFFKKLPFALHF